MPPTAETPGAARLRRTWFLSSRVARQIFVLFLVCALLPLLLFAGIALRNVSEQLEEQAEARLHQECKSVGMTIVERLLYLRDDLSLLLSGPAATSLDLDLVPTTLRERLESRFTWLALGDGDSEPVAATRAGIALPELAPAEREHLARENVLATFHRRADGSPRIVLVLPVPGAAEGLVAYGEVDGAFLWSGDGILRPNSEVLVLTETGDTLFSTVADPAFEHETARALRADPSNGRFEWDADDGVHVASYRTVFTKPQIGRNIVLARSEPRTGVVAPMAEFKQVFVLFAALSLLGIVLASLTQIRRSLVPIETLRAATESIARQEFGARVKIETKDEFRDLGRSFNAMAEGLERHIATLDELHGIGVALTAERSSSRLLEIIGAGARRLTEADIVRIHLLDEDGSLRTAHVSHGQRDAGLAAGLQRGAALVELAVESDRTIAVDDLAAAGDSGLYDDLGEELGVSVRSALCVPMRNHEHETMGALEVLRASDPATGAARPLGAADRQLAESLASQAAVAMTKNRLVDDFRKLFESLSELIAIAIDEKSRYTGAHCRRVPVLTMMIAEEACKASEGTFQDFTFTEDQLYELKVAALLHDCGKVVTPVHVVDKATKLETIFDRVELVATRFEVARRDLEVEHLRAALADAELDPERRARVERELAEDVAALEDDVRFIRHWNIGGESMPEEAQERVRAIAAARSWLDPQGARRAILEDDEVENLCISRGTLTQEEREVINYHVVATVKMLEQLPYPRHLRGVPQIAGAHHERMDGKGYPLGLERSQITLQGRILGIADIFEALTAKDRPYKPGKSLTETLAILGEMKEAGHVDPDLFQLFVESGVYARYASEFLDEDQIDEVDLAAIPGFEPSGANTRLAG